MMRAQLSGGRDSDPPREVVFGACLWAIDGTSQNENRQIFGRDGRLLFEGPSLFATQRLTGLDPGFHKVLISGSGDAATGDYIAVLTRHTSGAPSRPTMRPTA